MIDLEFLKSVNCNMYFFSKWPSIVLQSLVFQTGLHIVLTIFFLLICEKCELTNLYYISIFFLIRVYFSSGIHCVESNMSFLQGFSWLKLNIRTIKPIPKTQPAIASMKPGSVQNLQLVIRKKVWIIYHPIYWISLSPFLIIQLAWKKFLHFVWIPFMLSKSWLQKPNSSNSHNWWSIIVIAKCNS